MRKCGSYSRLVPASGSWYLVFMAFNTRLPSTTLCSAHFHFKLLEDYFKINKAFWFWQYIPDPVFCLIGEKKNKNLMIMFITSWRHSLISILSIELLFFESAYPVLYTQNIRSDLFLHSREVDWIKSWNLHLIQNKVFPRTSEMLRSLLV